MGKQQRRKAGPGPSGAARLRPGRISPERAVPADIERPPYIPGGDPGPSSTRVVSPPDVVERMRVAGRLAAEVLVEAGKAVAPGVRTDELDVLVHEATVERGAYPSPLGYRGFPKSVCTSVNECICHGIPDDRPLADGDIVNVDVTVFFDGVHGDTNATFLVGRVDPESRRLVRATYDALWAGIGAVRPGTPLNAIGRAIGEVAAQQQLGVVREFVGHGIGEQFHTALKVLHYFDPGQSLPLAPGMTFTIEPMITLGSPRVRLWDDGWTAVTRDGSRTAQFEHTLVVTDDGFEVLTLLGDGTEPASLFLPA